MFGDMITSSPEEIPFSFNKGLVDPDLSWLPFWLFSSHNICGRLVSGIKSYRTGNGEETEFDMKTLEDECDTMTQDEDEWLLCVFVHYMGQRFWPRRLPKCHTLSKILSWLISKFKQHKQEIINKPPIRITRKQNCKIKNMWVFFNLQYTYFFSRAFTLLHTWLILKFICR
jgi:hypothetical protein